MKLVGLIGGLGPESTIDYYRQIIATYQQRRPDGSYPELLIHSLDLQKGLRLATENRLAELADFLAPAVDALARAGTDFVAITANTAHLVFDELASRSPVPMLSIVETARDAAAAKGLRRLALLGTRMTMQAAFYPEVFARAAIALVAPSLEDRERIHDKYIHELLIGKFEPEARDLITGLINKLQREQGIEGVVLAGTELPLLLRGADIGGLAMLDTTQIHVDAIVARIVA